MPMIPFMGVRISMTYSGEDSLLASFALAASWASWLDPNGLLFKPLVACPNLIG